jgi:acetyltransferase-like isoleucine patch superfamily enzyme
MNLKKLISFFKNGKGNKQPAAPVSTNKVSKLALLFNGVDMHNTVVGDYSYIGRNSIVHNTTIGKFSSIGPNAVIGYGEHPVNFVSTSPVFYQSTTSFDIKPQKDYFFGHQGVDIGSDVWIGANCFLRNGIKVGHGAIIGAGAVVTKDVPPYAVITGVPGSIRKFRFSDEVVEKLLAIEWWNWDLNTIKSSHSHFTTSDINGFINKYYTK